MKSKNTLFLLPVSIFLVLTLNFTNTFAAKRYWVGSGSGNWNKTNNWSNSSGGSAGFSVPAITDTIYFDGGNTTNCIIDTNINVAGVSISNFYTGTISLNSGISVIVDTLGFLQSGGIFNGNNGNITIRGRFQLNGGTFNSTTGTLQIGGGFNYSGATFNHNGGQVSFSGTQTITGNATFYNLLFAANGGWYTISTGTKITTLNNVSIIGGYACIINTGIVEIKGNLTTSGTQNNSFNGGTGTLLFNGTGTQTISSYISSISIGTNERVGSLPNIEINKTSGSLNLVGVINLNGTSWNTIAGASLINPGVSTININSNVTFTGQNLSLYRIHIYANGQTIVLSPASYKLISTNNVTIDGGSFYVVNTGILNIKGDLTLNNTSTSAVNGGTGTFLFDGSGIQNINSSASSLNYVCALPSVTINKTSGTLFIRGILNFSGASWNTIAGASLIDAGTSVVNLLKHTTLSGQSLTLYDITVTGNFSTTTISAGVVWCNTPLY